MTCNYFRCQVDIYGIIVPGEAILTRKSNVFELDFHYYYVEEAVFTVEGVINQVRLHQKPLYCRFITGRGKIQASLVELLKVTYGLDPVIPLSNSGVIDVYIY